MFTYYSISALINFLVSLLASVFLVIVVRKNIRDEVIQAFLRFAFFVIFWSGFYFLWQVSHDYKSALIYTKLLIFFAAFIPIAYLDFVISFLGFRNKRNTLLIIFGYLLFFLFSYKGLVATVVPKLSFTFWPNGTELFPAFLSLWVFIFFLSILILFVSLLKTPKSHAQYKYVTLLFIAISVGAVGGATNYFLWFDIPVKPFGNILVSVYFFMTLYTVRKYNVDNFRVFYIQLASLIVCMFAFGRIPLSQNSFDFYTNIVFFVVVIVASINIIKFSKEEEKYQNVLQETLKKLSRANSQIKNANEKLKSLDLLKSEFVSLASHQLRSPLTVIKGYSAVLADSKLSEKDLEMVNHIYVAAQGMANVVEDFLNVTKIEQGGMKYVFAPVDIRAVVNDLLSDMKLAAQDKKLEFISEIDQEGIYILSVDGVKIKQVFLNLIDNSIKYTKEGFVKVVLKKDTESIIFSVVDSGIGLSEETKVKLFQKFSRADEKVLNSGGSGLGLYLAQEIVLAHRGVITVDSYGLGKGSTFSVALPCNK